MPPRTSSKKKKDGPEQKVDLDAKNGPKGRRKVDPDGKISLKGRRKVDRDSKIGLKGRRKSRPGQKVGLEASFVGPAAAGRLERAKLRKF